LLTGDLLRLRNLFGGSGLGGGELAQRADGS